MSFNDGKVELNLLKFSFKVENFSERTNETLEYEVNFEQETWSVHVEAFKGNEFVGISLHKMFDEITNVCFTASIVVDNKVIKTDSMAHTYEDEGEGITFPKFILRNYLLQLISLHFSFTVVAEIQIIDDPKFHSPEMRIPTQLRSVCEYDFHDLDIQVKGSQWLSAHRFLLSTYSPVLCEVILDLNDSDPLIIEDINFEIVQEVLNFIYGKEVKKTDENVKEILLAAKKYQIEGLQKECEKFIFQKVTVGNVFETLIFSHDHSFLDLFDETVKFADENIKVLLKMKTQWEQLVAEHPCIIKNIFKQIMKNASIKFYSDWRSHRSSRKNENSKADYNASNDFEYLYNSMDFSDVVFDLEEKTLTAHKCILISRSTVFRAMFTHNTMESNKNHVKIPDINYSTMKQLLQYIYCGKVTDLKENAIDLFSAADKYNLKELKDLCKDSIKQNITVENITEILKFVDLHSSEVTDLKEMVTNFIKKNFESISKTDEWGDFALDNSRILSEMIIQFVADIK